jgi:hypothetical protein
MLELNSRKVTVHKSPEHLCDYLSDVKNFEQLMPENISKFELLNERSFIFSLKGMPEISLEVREVNHPNHISLGSIDDKIPFNLTGTIEPIDSENSSIQLKFNGDFNPMLSMMIKGPISKFLETLVVGLESLE